jgi:hypothetical protein
MCGVLGIPVSAEPQLLLRDCGLELGVSEVAPCIGNVGLEPIRSGLNLPHGQFLLETLDPAVQGSTANHASFGV